MVCMGRAVADALQLVARLRDPTALPLLSEAARNHVTRYLKKQPPRGLRELMSYLRMPKLAAVMAVRTLAIDDAITSAAAPQLVILGAGLDGRAFRMPELRDAIVFEVDHPDTQCDKQAQASQLMAAAKELRFVPVDFTRDSLDDALARAGHDPNRPTTWVWEGVVMYLTHEAIEATLQVIARRSAPDSQLLILYHVRTPLLLIVGPMVRRLGEPLRSHFTVDSVRQLLARFGFAVLRDHDTPGLAREHAPALAKQVSIATHLRLVVARRLPPA
jgi:methyltransferase (TIGR00027 family)